MYRTLIFLFLISSQLISSAPSAPPPPGKPEKEEKVTAKGGKEHKIEREEEGRSPKRSRTSTSASSTASTSASASSSATTAPVSTAFAASPASAAPSASSSSSTASTAAAAKEKEAGSLEPEAPSGQEIRLISKEGKAFAIPRAVITDLNVSPFLAEIVKNNEAEAEIPLPRITTDMLQVLSPILVGIHNILYDQLLRNADKKLSRREIIHKIVLLTKPITDAQLPAFLDAANYLDASTLSEALAWRYAGLLEPLENQPHIILAKVQTDGISDDVLALISQMVLIRSGIDIDPIIFPGKKVRSAIPVERLIAYGKLPKDIVDIIQKQKKGIKTGFSPLTKAAFEKNRSAIKALLRTPDIDVNAKDEWTTALDYAVSGGFPGEDDEVTDKEAYECAKLLLDAGADPNTTNMSGGTPLHTAASHVLPKTVQLLIQHKSDVNARNEAYDPNNAGRMSARNTPLHLVFLRGNDTRRAMNQFVVADILLTAGATLDARNDFGETPFWIAIDNLVPQFLPQAVKFFTHRHADVNAVQTIARQEGDPRNTTILLNLLIRWNTDLATHVGSPSDYEQAKKAVRLLLAAGADVTLADSDLNSPANIASELVMRDPANQDILDEIHAIYSKSSSAQ